MENGLIIKAQIKDVVIAKINHAFATLSVRDAVSELEELTPNEIRGYLVESGLTENILKLREITEASMTMQGGEDHSAIIEVLKPSEISQITKISSEIFDDEHNLIHPSDHNDPGKWDTISQEQYQEILKNGDQKIINRISGGKEGPWKIFRDEIKISPEAVNAFFTAICNTERSDEWKVLSIKAVGLDLLAFACRSIDSIYVRCLEEFPDIAESITDIIAKGTDWQDASASHLSSLERLQKELSSENIVVETGDLAKMIKGLRDVGIDEPTVTDIVDTIEFNEGIDVVLTAGIPE